MPPSPESAAEDYSQQSRTFRLELARALPMGFIETAISTFAIFIAIRVFDLPIWMKASIISSGSAGLLLSLFVVQFVRRHGYSVNNVVAALWSITTLGFAMAALARSSGTLFFIGHLPRLPHACRRLPADGADLPETFSE